MARSSCSFGSVGKSRPVVSRTIALNSRDQLAQVVGVEVGVLRRRRAALLGASSACVERLAVDAHHDPPEHLDEAPVRVPAEALVAGQRDQAVQRLLVEAQVEDRVHHPGHRELGAGADAHEQRVRRRRRSPCRSRARPRLTASRTSSQRPSGSFSPVGEVVVAGLGGDREAGRHRQARVGHLGEAGALAAEQVAHRRVALGAAAAPGVDVALGGAVGALGGRVAVSVIGQGPSGRVRGRPRGPRRRSSCAADCTVATPDASGCETVATVHAGWRGVQDIGRVISTDDRLKGAPNASLLLSADRAAGPDG